MRVLYISTIAYSDVDLSYLQEASKLVDTTYIVTISPYNTASCALDFRGVNLKDGFNCAVEIPQLQKFGKLVNLSKFYVFKNPSKHAYEPKAFVYWSKLFKFIKRGEYDVVHMTYLPSFLNVFPCFIKRKLVFTIHDPLPHSSASYKMDRYNRIAAFRRYQNFILLNTAQREEFINFYHLNKKDVSIFESKLSSYDYLHMYQNEPLSEDSPYILFFGNIQKYKGLEYLFEAMSVVYQSNPEVKLIVAGRGNYYFDLDKYKKLGCYDIRNSFINDDELASLVKNSLFVVVPYVDATQSGVVMTAYAFSKPCVATNVGGLPEMVIDGEYGFIVPPRDSNELAKAINNLLNNRILLDTFSNNIYRDYQEGCKSWKQISKGMMSIYKEVYDKSINDRPIA